jgi:hypothetical protein
MRRGSAEANHAELQEQRGNFAKISVLAFDWRTHSLVGGILPAHEQNEVRVEEAK